MGMMEEDSVSYAHPRAEGTENDFMPMPDRRIWERPTCEVILTVHWEGGAVTNHRPKELDFNDAGLIILNSSRTEQSFSPWNRIKAVTQTTTVSDGSAPPFSLDLARRFG